MRAFTLACAVSAVFALSDVAQAETASIRADFQPIVDGTITIAKIVTSVDGFLVVRLPKNRKPMYGKTMAVVPLKAGTHTNVKVKLTAGIKPGATLAIMLHTDDGIRSKYEFSAPREGRHARL